MNSLWCTSRISKHTELEQHQTAQYQPQGKTLQPKTGSLFNLQPHFYDSTLCGKANWNNGKELLEVMFATTNQSEDPTLG